MLAAHEKRRELDLSISARQTARDAATDMRRCIKRTQRLGLKNMYDKAFKALAQISTLDTASPGM